MENEKCRPAVEHTACYRPEVVVLETPCLVDRYAFRIVEAQIYSNKHSVLTLPTGSSPVGLYGLLVEACRKGLDMSGLCTRNLDEYWPLPGGHPQSYDYFMRRNLFDYVNIPPSQRHIPSCEASDAGEEVSRYREVLKNTGPADLAVLGIGPGLTCHIAFNERGSRVDCRTRLVQIDEETIKANARFFDSPNQVPRRAITQGIADILEARKIILIAKGCRKALGVQMALQGPMGSDAPASFLRLHPDVTFIIDQEAGSLLV